MYLRKIIFILRLGGGNTYGSEKIKNKSNKT